MKAADTLMGGVYSASCPMCGTEHDYATKREMNTDWAAWTRPLEKAMDGLSVALTDQDKNHLRHSVGMLRQPEALSAGEPD